MLLPFQKATIKLLVFLLKLSNVLKLLLTMPELILYFKYYFVATLIAKMANVECFKNDHFH